MHELDVREPGFHGATSRTARCSEGCWSQSVFTDAGAPPRDAWLATMRERQAAHVREHDQDVAERARLERLWRKATPEEAKYIPSEPRHADYRATPAAPPRGDAPFPVVHLKADGTAILHPRGYRNGRVSVLDAGDPLLTITNPPGGLQ